MTQYTTPAASPAMRRTPPGGPPCAIALAEPDEPLPTFWQRLLALAAKLRRSGGVFPSRRR